MREREKSGQKQKQRQRWFANQGGDGNEFRYIVWVGPLFLNVSKGNEITSIFGNFFFTLSFLSL